MDVVVSKRDLARVLGRCQGIADKKSTMPILGNVVLEVVGPDRLRLAATDLYLAVSGSIPAEVKRGGSVAVGARDLFERVRMMPEGQIALASADGATTIVQSVSSPRRYTVHGMPGDDFPALPAADPAAPSYTIGVDTLLRLITATHFSISPDDTRLHLNSALFEWDGDRVRMVATDGHRLTKLEMHVPGKHAGASMLIPLKAVLELKRLCEDAKGEPPRPEGDKPAATEIRLAQSGACLFAGVGGFDFSAKLVDAQFPPYQQVIPDTTERAVRAPRLAVAEALRAVAITASERTGGVKLTITTGTLRFASESSEGGAAFDEVPVDYEGPELTLGFNARYLLDVLGVIEDDEVILGVSGELDPAVLRPATESTRSRYLAVVMPMRV